MTFRQSVWGVAFVAIVAAAQLTYVAAARGQSNSAAGAPGSEAASPGIYLDEPEVIAEPAPVRTREAAPPVTYPDGKVWIERQVTYYSDNSAEPDGVYREYYPNGKMFVDGEYRRGRQHGTWTYYFDNGQVNRKAIYSNGQPNGAWDIFRSDGTLAAKRSFKDGVRDGEWITYDETGKQPLREEHYVDGKRDGVWNVWFPSGQQRQQATFRMDERHGPMIEWNERGEKTIEATYAEGKLNGTYRQRLADGRSVVQQYENGRLVSQTRQ